MILFMIVIFLCFWLFTPVFFNLPAEFDKFIERYPNKYKQLIIIFLHGPAVIVIFGGYWLLENIFNNINIFTNFRSWLRK